MWRVVLDGKKSLEEVKRWNLEEIYKFNALLDMRDDYQAAVNEMAREQSEVKTK